MSVTSEVPGSRYIVTGGSSGIGLALTRRLVGGGHIVSTVSRRPPPGSRDRVIPLLCDLSEPEGLESRLAPLLDGDTPEGVVFCHGAGDFGAIEQFSAERIQRMVNLHVTSTLLLCRMLVPSMKRRGQGTLVLVGSEAALRGTQRGAVYCATKFALRGAAQALREECSSGGVRVGIVNPGMVDTPFFDSLDFAPGPNLVNRLDAEQVVDAIELMLSAPGHAVIDEINLSPLKKVIRKV